jgi:hypothetical protein
LGTIARYIVASIVLDVTLHPSGKALFTMAYVSRVVGLALAATLASFAAVGVATPA